MKKFTNSQDEVQKKLWKSLTALMRKQNIDDIATSELLQQSGISRSTFYRRYLDKYDLLNQCYQQLLNQTICQVTEGVSYKKAFYHLYQTLQSDPLFYKNALASNDYNGLRNYIFRQSFQVFESLLEQQGIDIKDRYIHLLLTGFISGALEVTCIWAEEGMKEPVETMFQLSYQLMPDIIQTCIALFYM